MNLNTEYEKFTQEIYLGLMNPKGVQTVDVKHNVKLKGSSGQQHQVDVYWEYQIDGVVHKVIIECKNYNTAIPIGKVRDFYGLLADLTNVSGIMVTKMGYQAGAKAYACYYGINLKELRTPTLEEAIIGEIQIHTQIACRRRLFLIDKQWAELNNISLESLENWFAGISLWDGELRNDGYFPLEISTGASILNKKRQRISTLDELENKLSEDNEHIFNFEDAYVDTRYWGQMKINAVKYISNETQEKKIFAIDARNIIKAILKDVLSGEIMFFDERGNIKQE